MNRLLKKGLPMFVTRASFVANVGEKSYQIMCDNDSPLQDVIIFLKYALEHSEKMLAERLKAEEAKKAEENPFEPAVEAELVKE
jgi:hypothetical protein